MMVEMENRHAPTNWMMAAAYPQSRNLRGCCQADKAAADIRHIVQAIVHVEIISVGAKTAL